MTLLLLACAVLQSESSSRIEVRAELKDGTAMEGTVEQEFSLDATYGTIKLKPTQIASMKFGRQTTVTASDGTVLRGKLNRRSITISNFEETQSFLLSEIVSLQVVRRAQHLPGEISNGQHANGMTYHLRLPKDYQPNEPRPAIVILHGSNMNARVYVESIVKTWPELARKYVLIGINGERRSARSTPENPAYNYTYINFGGNSKYSGTVARESPIFVKEVVDDLKRDLPLERIFVGGHSQGGFLTYSLIMNYPDLFAGAFPMSCGLIVQTAPDAFDDMDIVEEQKSRPIAIVHSQSDRVVAFSSAQTAFDAFEEQNFPLVRLFDHKTAAHRFIFLPVKDAITWLDEMSSRQPEQLLKTAKQRVADSIWNDAISLVARAEKLDSTNKAFATEIADIKQQVGKAIESQVAPLHAELLANENGQWVERYLTFRKQFAQADHPAVTKIHADYLKLRERHQPQADKLYSAAKQDFRNQKRDKAYARYQEVVDKYYASSWFAKMKRWLAERD